VTELFSNGSRARVFGAALAGAVGGEDREETVVEWAGDRGESWLGGAAHPAAVKRKKTEAMAVSNR
jgi:hypothetical protein